MKLLYLLVIISFSSWGCSIQDQFLYDPGGPRPSESLAASQHLRFWPVPGDGYRGFIALAEPAETRGTIVVFHGNGGTALDRAFYVQILGPMGYRVILAEYPAYGGRGGAVGEDSFARDARETIRLVREKYRGPLFLLGESLGCGVAAAAARDLAPAIEGIILITPWDTLAAVAKTKFPSFVVSLLLRDNYDSMDNLKSFPKRVAVVGAERDELIPLNHADTLYRSLPQPKRMWIIPKAGHNDWLAFVDKEWWEEVVAFINPG